MACPICFKNTNRYFQAKPLDNLMACYVNYNYCHGCDILHLDELSINQDCDYSDSGYYRIDKPRYYNLLEMISFILSKNKLRLINDVVDISGAKILDIGCGKGRFLAVAQKCGADVYGVEPTLRSFKPAFELLGNKVVNSIIKDGMYSNKYFDVITLWHVFEHLSDPSSVLALCKGLLHDKGILVIAVPNYRGWIARIGGPLWFNLDPPRHVIHYNSKSIRSFLDREGYTVVKISNSYPEITYLSALQTLLNKLFITPNFLFNYLKRNSNALPTNKLSYSIDMILSIIFSILLFPVVVIFVKLSEWFQASDCITVFATLKIQRDD